MRQTRFPQLVGRRFGDRAARNRAGKDTQDVAMDPRRDAEEARGGIGNLPDGLSLAKGAGVGLQFYLGVLWALSETNRSAVN